MLLFDLVAAKDVFNAHENYLYSHLPDLGDACLMGEELLGFLWVLFQVAQGIPRRKLKNPGGLKDHQAVEHLHEHDG
jgi:hypothetical protein